MSHRTLLRLGVMVVTLLILWVGSELLSRRPSDSAGELALAAVDPTAVTAATIASSGETIRLVRDGDGWLVNGYVADPERVTELLGAVQELAAPQLVGENPEVHPRFEVDEPNARHIQLMVGGVTALDLLVGKATPDTRSRYIREPGGVEVYTLAGTLGTQVDRPLVDWRDRTILEVTPDSIGEMEITRYGNSRVLARSDSASFTSGGMSADSTTISRMLAQLTHLRAAGFPSVAEMDSVQLESPDRVLQLRRGDGAALTTLAFDSTSTGFWVRKMGDSIVFRMDRFRVEQVTPPDSLLFRGGG